MDHGSYQQQGGGLGYTGNGFVTDDDPVNGAVEANVLPALDDGAGGAGSLTEEIQPRSVSIGRLFGRSAAAMGSKNQGSGLEVRRVFIFVGGLL